MEEIGICDNCGLELEINSINRLCKMCESIFKGELLKEYMEEPTQEDFNKKSKYDLNGFV